MKKTLLVGLAIGVVSMVATAAFAGKSPTKNIPAQGFATAKNYGGNGIVGSSHDLSNVGNTVASMHSSGFASGTDGTASDAQSRICVFCHHPHNSMAVATMPGGYSPLWNRELSTKTFNPYNNGGFANATGTPHALQAVSAGLSGVSLLCMSCHDGVVAMNAYSQTTGSDENKGDLSIGGAINSSAGFGGKGGASDMSNHHPMGFNYAAVQSVDNEIASPNTPMVPTGLTQAGGDFSAVNTGVVIADLLDGTHGTGNMECVTCHDVHNTQNAPGAERFLWRSNNNSNFCLTCHLK